MKVKIIKKEIKKTWDQDVSKQEKLEGLWTRFLNRLKQLKKKQKKEKSKNNKDNK